MRLDAGLMERLRPLADGFVGVLSIQEVDLLESAAVGLDTVETSHSDDCRRNLNQLVHARLVLSGTLPHVPEDQAEFYFSFHYLDFFDIHDMAFAAGDLGYGRFEHRPHCGCIVCRDFCGCGGFLL